MPWMIRIGSTIEPALQERSFQSAGGDMRVDQAGSPALLNSLLYKLCYHRFGHVTTDAGRPGGWDRVRQQEIGNKEARLEYLEEAFTSEHWIVRVYRVLPPDNRG